MKSHEKQWKTLKNNENQYKSMEIEQHPWKFMGNQNSELHWIFKYILKYQENVMKFFLPRARIL